MRSRREHPPQSTGAHRAHSVRREPAHQAKQGSRVRQDRPGEPPHPADTSRAVVAPGQPAVPGQADRGHPDPGRTGPGRAGPPGHGLVARYEPYLDGLFTYCLSVMCEHDAATESLAEALALAERQHERERVPTQPGLYRPWLYSLARWACLRRLVEQDGDHRTAGVPGAHTAGAGSASAARLSEPVRTQRRRELAALAWPEAAGTTPEQREALELAVRHGLPAPEVAAVLSLASDAALQLLSNAACEVERTRAALAVVESGGCTAVARLAGDDRLLLGTALRRELVRHVDECTECRGVAERAMAGVSWPGTAPAGTAELAVLDAPRAVIAAAVTVVRRARFQRSPRFDRTGFPLELKDRAARRNRIRSRAVTTTVVATVVAAPVLALWAAYRGAPLTGEPDGSSVSAAEREAAGLGGHPYENAAQDGPRLGREPGSSPRSPRVSVDSDGSPTARPGDRSAGRLSIDARPAGDATLVTLTASGRSPVHWTATSDASWLQLSRTSGVLQPGESVHVRVLVDRAAEPGRAWAAHLRFAPSDSVVTLQGRGSGDSPGTPPSDGPVDPPSNDPPPSQPPSGPPPSEEPPPSGDPSPSDPPPSEDPSPSDPPSSEEPPPSSDPPPSDPPPPADEPSSTSPSTTS